MVHVSKLRVVRFVQALCVVCYAAYFVHLRADFPNGSPWNDFAKFTDEGWYAGAALHHAQTGRWYVAEGFNPAVGLPAWPLLLAGWFALVGGPGIVAARTLTVLLFGGSLLLLSALLRPVVGRLVAALTVLLILVNPYCFSFDRLALLEPLVVFLFLLALWIATVPQILHRHREPYVHSIVVGALLTTAILAKTTAIVLAPALLYQLWATASGPSARSQLLPGTGPQSAVRPAGNKRRAVLLPIVAVITAALLWAAYFWLLVQPHYLPDYRQLFAVNAGKAHGRILLQVMAQALGNTLWIDRILLPLTIVAVAASTRFLRELWHLPLFVSSVASLLCTVAFIGWHTWFQPRYYLLCVFPAMIVLAIATHGLGTRARGLRSSSAWRIAHRLTLVALATATATMFLQTARYLLHPQYTLRDAAEQIAATMCTSPMCTNPMRGNPGYAPILLASSGDTIALFTGIRAVNPEWPIGGLPALLEREHPGWYAAYTPLDDKATSKLRALCQLEPVARHRVFDEPEHQSLVLYRLSFRR